MSDQSDERSTTQEGCGERFVKLVATRGRGCVYVELVLASGLTASLSLPAGMSDRDVEEVAAAVGIAACYDRNHAELGRDSKREEVQFEMVNSSTEVH